MNIERPVIANAEKAFVRDAILKHGLRLDGRRDVDSRPLLVRFCGNGVCEAQLGRTRVMAEISCVITEPFGDRAHDGSYVFDVALSPMASAAFPKDGFTQASNFVSRVVERSLKESNAIDTESLCIVAGSKVISSWCYYCFFNNRLRLFAGVVCVSRSDCG